MSFCVPTMETDPWLHVFLEDWKDMADYISRKKLQTSLVVAKESHGFLVARQGNGECMPVLNGTNAPTCVAYRLDGTNNTCFVGGLS